MTKLEQRIPPQNKEAEMSILGAVFLDNACFKKVSGMIDAMDFYTEAHREIFKAMNSLALSKTPIDLVTVVKRMQEEEILSSCGGPGYLMELIDYVPTSANVVHYCKIVKEAATKRQLIQYGQKLVSLGYGHDPVTEQMKEAKNELSEITGQLDSFGGVSIADISTVNQRAERYIKQAKTFDKSRLITGYPMLDDIIRGVAPGEVLTIIAEPGGFKTAWLQNVLLADAKRTGFFSLFFSLEMPIEKVFEREAQIATGTTGRQIEAHYKAMDNRAKQIQSSVYVNGSMGLLVCDKPRLDLDKISRYIELARNKYGKVNAVGIDYMGLLAGPGRTLFEKTAHNAPEIKHLAKEHGVPFILLCQINREGQKIRHDIDITDAKGGGDIEASADIMLGFYSDEEENLICKILKNRNGPKGGRLLCDIDRASFRFLSMSEYKKEEKPPAKKKAVT